ncbi:MAG TPA: protein-disulfide reductase DsbD domain-containing protein, partial [Methylovirgula sp.]|nr:protein-disulfide reductase DsbD domain-containing protein [Methylovirgula sp.]
MFRTLRPFICFALSLTSASLAGVSVAYALESAPVVTPHATVTLVSETDAIDPAKPFRLGLHFKLAKDWHIYWSNPGVAGEPPTIDLDMPQGAKASPIAWPTPTRAQEGPAMTYSYFDDVLLPLTVTPAGASSSFPIKAKVSWLICDKICVPESGTFNLTLPLGNPAPSADASLFKAADARMPLPSPFTASVSAKGLLSLTGKGLSPQSVHDAWFFPASWGMIDDLAPQVLKVADGELSLALKPGETFDPKAGMNGVIVLKDDAGQERAYTIAAPLQGGALASSATPAPAAAPAPSATVASSAARAPAAPSTLDQSLVVTLAFAFLGGLILNLMPCVFPILAMKAVSLAKLSGHEDRSVRAHAASYTLGVLAAFAALAGLLLALRA